MTSTKLTKSKTKTLASTSTIALTFLIVGASSVILGVGIFALAFASTGSNKPVFRMAATTSTTNDNTNSNTNSNTNTNTNTSPVCVPTSGFIEKTTSKKVNDCQAVSDQEVEDLCGEARMIALNDYVNIKCNPGCILDEPRKWTSIYRCGFYISPVDNNNSTICWILWGGFQPYSGIWDLCRYGANEIGLIDANTASCKTIQRWECISYEEYIRRAELFENITP